MERRDWWTLKTTVTDYFIILKNVNPAFSPMCGFGSLRVTSDGRMPLPIPACAHSSSHRSTPPASTATFLFNLRSSTVARPSSHQPLPPPRNFQPLHRLNDLADGSSQAPAPPTRTHDASLAAGGRRLVVCRSELPQILRLQRCLTSPLFTGPPVQPATARFRLPE